MYNLLLIYFSNLCPFSPFSFRYLINLWYSLITLFSSSPSSHHPTFHAASFFWYHHTEFSTYSLFSLPIFNCPYSFLFCPLIISLLFIFSSCKNKPRLAIIFQYDCITLAVHVHIFLTWHFPSLFIIFQSFQHFFQITTTTIIISYNSCLLNFKRVHAVTILRFSRYFFYYIYYFTIILYLCVSWSIAYYYLYHIIVTRHEAYNTDIHDKNYMRKWKEIHKTFEFLCLAFIYFLMHILFFLFNFSTMLVTCKKNV